MSSTLLIILIVIAVLVLGLIAFLINPAAALCLGAARTRLDVRVPPVCSAA